MAPSYKFSIIQARPSAIRGERVNVGLVVFGPNGLDVRLPEVRKLMHLTGHKWDDIATAYYTVLSKSSLHHLDELREKSAVRSDVFSMSSAGEIRAAGLDEYEANVAKILNIYVDKPALTRKEKQQKINSEITAMLRKVGVLADKGQTINDGKVIQKFVVSEDKEIVADFAYKANGLKVVSTLELRGLKTSAHSKACEKGATLYFAREQFGPTMTPFGVYAVNAAEVEAYRGEIEILTSFANGNAFNWMDAKDRQKFKQALY
ncbi:hypothetical protein [Mesorhizobium sp. M7A.F.Ca.US.010.02.1.1]|uniref:hypothetical protein n=1 Tax=Mesorhizobium sp. M7A.F.Ca.US.010.02.1.1 TaxID=2496743 RepID=UPI000FD2A208|nr:hypothetical protein [Mesorhizobium sp. M7A.F.Ca.US.010.02.1.1]RUW92548.1 hypothetical protein EOA19_11700 [Mesorhizobium sp. M7A.F.Ca.US.010.02.1.1]